MKRLLLVEIMVFSSIFIQPAFAGTTSLSGKVSPIMAKKSCMAAVAGKGSANGAGSELLAKSRAKDDWRDRSASTYGSQYRHWLRSEGKGLQCTRSGGIANRVWTCTALSQPCS
jgi:hypothetical protein